MFSARRTDSANQNGRQQDLIYIYLLLYNNNSLLFSWRFKASWYALGWDGFQSILQRETNVCIGVGFLDLENLGMASWCFHDLYKFYPTLIGNERHGGCEFLGYPRCVCLEMRSPVVALVSPHQVAANGSWANYLYVCVWSSVPLTLRVV